MRRWVLTVAGIVLTALHFLQAETTVSTEYEVKAAFLYNFAKFVEWPPEVLQKNPGTLTIGVMGEDPFGSDLDHELEGKTVQDRKLVLRRVSSMDEASACQVLFISASIDGRLKAILSTLRDLPVLTVSDMDRFVQRGGMVGLSVEEKRVRFSINIAAATLANLKVSSQLLKLAKTVISRRPAAPEFVWNPFRIIPSAGS